MARKQSDYLADILADAPEGGAQAAVDRDLVTGERGSQLASQPSPSGAQRAGMSLLGRETALSRVASGGVKQVTQLQLDPAQVRIWAGNARLQGHLSDENCRDLIDSMIAEGGQKVAAVVRRINGDPAFDYEVIAGTRRHFAISWLRANSYPGMKFLRKWPSLMTKPPSALPISKIGHARMCRISNVPATMSQRSKFIMAVSSAAWPSG